MQAATGEHLRVAITYTLTALVCGHVTRAHELGANANGDTCDMQWAIIAFEDSDDGGHHCLPICEATGGCVAAVSFEGTCGYTVGKEAG